MNEMIKSKFDFDNKLKLETKIVLERVQIIPCKCCNFKGIDNTTLTEHMNDCPVKERKFECQYCDYKAFIKDTLKTHIRGLHEKMKIFKCEICDYISSYKGHVQRHVKVKGSYILSGQYAVLWVTMCFSTTMKLSHIRIYN